MKQPIKYLLEGQESSRLLFRRLEEADFDTWLDFCKDEHSLEYIFTKEQQAIKDPKEKCKIWFDKVFNRYNNGLGGMNVLIDKNSGEFVGQCGLLIQEVDNVTEMEIGYSIVPMFRNLGYASEAAIKCKNFAFENHFTESLISIIHPLNQASIKVASNNGMQFEKQALNHGEIMNIYRIVK